MRKRIVATAIVVAAWTQIVAAAEPDGIRVLRVAIDENNVSAVVRALNAGANPNALDEYALTPLVRAVISGNKAIVLEMLQRGANPNQPGVSRSPLEVAFSVITQTRVTCDVPMVKLLLENGANVNDPFPALGERPLQRALEIGDASCVTVVLDFGADPHARSVRGKSALEAAIQGASETNQPELVYRILALGAYVNGAPGRRGGPLVEATAQRNIVVARQLLGRGADPCLAEPHKPSAWDVAVGQRMEDMLELISTY